AVGDSDINADSITDENADSDPNSDANIDTDCNSYANSITDADTNRADLYPPRQSAGKRFRLQQLNSINLRECAEYCRRRTR
uniref:hypothetical protein n=1 Tax=Streptococcus agalactiae TaxID=1311 RepID=UPI00178C1F48